MALVAAQPGSMEEVDPTRVRSKRRRRECRQGTKLWFATTPRRSIAGSHLVAFCGKLGVEARRTRGAVEALNQELAWYHGENSDVFVLRSPPKERPRPASRLSFTRCCRSRGPCRGG